MSLLLAAAVALAPTGPADPKIAARVERVLARTPIIDGHNDLPWELRTGFDSKVEGVALDQPTNVGAHPLQTDIARLRKGHVGAQFWSVWIPTTLAGDEAIRTTLDALIHAKGEDYAGLSRLIGRNDAYIQQFIKRGTPRRLAPADRRRLADYLDVPEALLGGPPAALPPDLLVVPRYAVAASAGPGALPAEARAGPLALDAAWLRELAPHGTRHLSAIRVAGDSMEPTLRDGDEIIVDAAPAAAPLTDGIWVLRRDDALLVKRLARDPAGGGATILSDNPAYPPIGPVPLSALTIIGRVLWAGGRVR